MTIIDSVEVLAFRRKEEDGAWIYKELATREGQTCKQGDPCTDSSEESLAETSKRERCRGEEDDQHSGGLDSEERS